MGRYTEAMQARIRGRRLAARVRHPAGVGMVMWCPLCTKEVIRSDVGLSTAEQQAALDAHRAVCVTRKMRSVP